MIIHRQILGVFEQIN